MEAESALRLESLRAGYGSSDVLRGVSLDLHKGQVIGIVGRNGAGKTTLLRAISGVVRRRAGEVWAAGERLSRRPDGVARAGIIQVPEGRGMLAGLSVTENLKVARAALGLRWTSEVLQQTLGSFPELERLLERRAGLLSGGEQQLVALARGFIAEPRVLLIDELSLGLSPVAVSRTFEALASAVRQRGTSVILVDQDVVRVAELCDAVYLLRDGQLAERDRREGRRIAEEVALD